MTGVRRYGIAIALGVCLSATAVVVSRRPAPLVISPMAEGLMRSSSALLTGDVHLSAAPGMCSDLPVGGWTPAHPGPYEVIISVVYSHQPQPTPPPVSASDASPRCAPGTINTGADDAPICVHQDEPLFPYCRSEHDVIPCQHPDDLDDPFDEKWIIERNGRRYGPYPGFCEGQQRDDDVTRVLKMHGYRCVPVAAGWRERGERPWAW